MRRAVELLNAGQPSGSILAFLPGIAEIRRTMRECEAIARQTGLLVLPLHGDLSPSEQDRAVLPSAERKLILATNVAGVHSIGVRRRSVSWRASHRGTARMCSPGVL